MNRTPLKILMVSHLYPPYTGGGYELRCSWIAKALQKRNHKICIVTSSFGCGNPRRTPEFIDGIKVFRILHDYSHTHIARSRLQKLLRLKRQYSDVLNFLRVIDRFAPDIVNWWYMGGLCKGLLQIPPHKRIPDVHCIEDVWMRTLGTDVSGDSFGWDRFWAGRWQPANFSFLWQRVAHFLRWYAGKKGIPIRLKNLESNYACYISEFQRYANSSMRIKFKESSVIYGGALTEKFQFNRNWKDMKFRQPLRLLYSGAITESRRLNILLEALELMDSEDRKKFTLSVVGKPPVAKAKPYYIKQRNRVSKGKLKDSVVFLGQMPHDKMPDIYANHDLLVFTSARREGLPITMVEAMMAGCCILTTGAGGAAEVELAANLPSFAIDNALHLSKMLLRLQDDRIFLIESARRGQSVSLDKFTFDRMVDEFEQVLQGVVLS